MPASSRGPAPAAPQQVLVVVLVLLWCCLYSLTPAYTWFLSLPTPPPRP